MVQHLWNPLVSRHRHIESILTDSTRGYRNRSRSGVIYVNLVRVARAQNGKGFKVQPNVANV